MAEPRTALATEGSRAPVGRYGETFSGYGVC